MTEEKLAATRDGFGQALLKLGAENKNIIAITANLRESTRLDEFAQAYPDRFFEAGVAEPNALGIAAGLALCGKIPFVTSFGVFSPGGNWTQLRVSVCYSKANVKLVGSHAGISTGPDGATHQAIEDIAITRCLPNLVVVSPCDSLQAEQATRAAAEHQGPVYLRLTRNKSPIIISSKESFKLGQAQILRPGKDITLVATGPIIHQALLAADQLKGQIDLEIINLHTIKPLDKITILESLKKTKHLLTLEDHQVAGGMGSAVLEVLSQEMSVPAKLLGVKDRFGQSGQPEELLKEYGLTAADIIQAAKELR
jgi:transketolase